MPSLCRFFPVIVLVTVLTGCLSANKHELSIEDVQSFKFVSVECEAAPTLSGEWLNMRNDFLKSKGLLPPEGNEPIPPEQAQPRAEPSPVELRAFLSAQFSPRVKRVFAEPLAEELRGHRPVRVVVSLLQVQIAPAVSRFFRTLAAGQAGNSNSITVTFTIVDAKSGKVLLTSPPIHHSGTGGEFIVDFGGGKPGAFDPDPMTRMLASLQPQFSSWLFKRDR